MIDEQAQELEVAVNQKQAQMILTGDGEGTKVTIVWDKFKNISIKDRVEIVKKYKNLPVDYIIEAFAAEEISMPDVIMSGSQRLQKQ